jgi:hypothetical protein
MRTLHFLTDVHGPRLTGSPNYKVAAEWAAKQMTEWGLENARLEPWDFGRPGWSNERFAGFMLSPARDSLVGEVLAWTPGTNGTITGEAVRIEPPQCATPAAGGSPFGPPAAQAATTQEPAKCPTQQEVTAYLNSVKAKIGDRIVLVGKATTVPVSLTYSEARMDEAALRRRFDLDQAVPYTPPTPPRPAPGHLSNNQINEQVDQFLVANGALVRLNDAGREHGQIRAFQNRTYDMSKAVPTVVLRNEDYGRINRILDNGMPVELEFTIVNKEHPEGRTSYNVIAEIPGTDKKDEVVMLGAHFDSWHAGTGAVDNASGSAVMMEAMRILKASGLPLRRTVRLGLWTGEEQGLIGSRMYVTEMFGDRATMKTTAAHEKFAGYFNMDNGSGAIRGIYLQGNEAVAPIFEAWMKPFENLGMTTLTIRNTGGTDHGSFDAIGLPGWQFIQDPLDYGTRSHHTNWDVYERAVPADLMKNATIIAAFVYHTANRDQLLPRKPMPTPPPAGGGRGRGGQ